MKLRHIGAALIMLACMVSAAEASPRHRPTRHDSAVASQCVETNSGRTICRVWEGRSTGHLRVTAGHSREAAAERAAGSQYCHIRTAAGDITIACWLAPKMEGFIADVVARGFKGRVHCFSLSHSHVAGSLHFIAEACDFAQHGWGKTVAVMYHVADLARKWGLRDGCTFRDCGHVDSGRTAVARAHARRRRMAMR
jgi:hypothetical protein